MSRLNFMTKNFLYNKVMNNLKKLRKLHNLNQSDVAKIVGIEQSTYAKYERGEIPLNEIYARLLADYYNVSLSYLFDDSNKEIIITQEQLNNLIKARDTINKIEEIYKISQPISEKLFSNEEKLIYQKLIDFRTKISLEKNIPAYLILTNKTIIEIVDKKPKNKQDLFLIKGIEKKKIDQYGDTILKILNE